MFVLLTLAAVLLGASCSTGPSAVGSPPPATPTPVDTSVAASATPTTRGATNSGSPIPSASVVAASLPASDDHLVAQAHARFMAMFAVVGDPPNPDHPEIALTTTGVASARLRENLTTRRTEGRRTVGGYRSSIVSVTIESNRATVVDCSLDQSVGYGADGTVVAPADTSSFIRTSYLTRTSSGWRVEEFIRGDSCVPAS